MELRFDRFYRHDELTAILKGFAERRPELFALESIGRSHEGRDIWLVTVSHRDEPAADKPAFWIDGNIHAGELTASTACLYFLHSLEEGYGKDGDVTRLLDSRAFYICPRINPDGAEWALADQPKYIRSSTRPYPFDEDPVDGLSVEDFPGWLVWQALTLPKLEVFKAEATRLGADTWKVRLAVHNTGYLPTYVTKRALERKVTRGVVYEIELADGASLVGGKPRIEGAQLEGRASKPSLQAFLPNLDLSGDRGQCEWTVRAPAGARVSLVARHDRAGKVQVAVTLE